MKNCIFVAFLQSDALKHALFSDFALKSDSALKGKKLKITFFSKTTR